MKYYYSLIIALFLTITASAQFGQNSDIEVLAILSPSSTNTYSTVDTFDIEVRIRNNGPNTLIPGDEFIINYSVGDGTSNSVSIDTLLLVGFNRIMQVGEGRTYILAKDFIINGNNIFSACASVSGTTIYPININKFPGECEQFVVNIKDQSIKINKAYYANNQIVIKLNDVMAREINVYDITGKLINSRTNVQGKEVSIPFEKKTKGFYFVTITYKNGNQSTAKFVVSQ
ncbi:T9SS type A sorting domain-containing protein [Vicingaceae bacterium]|nr:T9SS type A sorting domain-containing protein [Vicingaceae bacterium]